MKVFRFKFPGTEINVMACDLQQALEFLPTPHQSVRSLHPNEFSWGLDEDGVLKIKRTKYWTRFRSSGILSQGFTDWRK